MTHSFPTRRPSVLIVNESSLDNQIRRGSFAMPIRCQDQTGDIHQWTKYSRCETNGCKFSHFLCNSRCKASVLHTHFNCNCTTIFLIHFKEPPRPIRSEKHTSDLQ